jgi:hypothetical protein
MTSGFDDKEFDPVSAGDISIALRESIQALGSVKYSNLDVLVGLAVVVAELMSRAPEPGDMIVNFMDTVTDVTTSLVGNEGKKRRRGAKV